MRAPQEEKSFCATPAQSSGTLLARVARARPPRESWRQVPRTQKHFVHPSRTDLSFFSLSSGFG